MLYCVQQGGSTADIVARLERAHGAELCPHPGCN
jgi:hypothetical protein